ncbi:MULTISPECIES: c-type cytochrome [unclassified Janthinobacterium]|uniref:c-type cytochrome n=1 Tax=unclassified Janthinobacterium TaxID=2610881 RepID=UPI0025B2BF73|nr:MULTISPECIES: c-type cytochrome [unclassified Janthinobacterium]MDN2700813.1 c-type cytochrome [Janthinobacterium sp. SUN100]MDN2714144.1 c-type cytochrome [Janthinobacterium sp. SUN120]MED5612727.1 c-type cytochrome [Janthinobacterium sp. P210005]
MQHPRFLPGLAAATLMAFSGAATAGDAMHGQVLYKSMCISCHSIDYNGVGPAHKGVFGRKAGSVADYNYSPAVKASAIVWGEKTLDQWLSGPEKLIPGQKMGYLVPSAQDRADLIAYLKQESARASPAQATK